MYCLLIAGVPGSGKTTLSEAIADKLNLPLLSKDAIKERLFDHVGFQSRQEKVSLGIASMEILYYAADRLMWAGLPFILENNFEFSSEAGIKALLEKHHYPALTVLLTGDYKAIYRRFQERELTPGRHRGHVVNDCYPERAGQASACPPAPSYEDYVRGIETRGFDAFSAGDAQLRVDATDPAAIDVEDICAQIDAWRKRLPRS